MAKTKKTETKHYEILFIVPNNFTEDEAKKINTSIESMIKDVGGEITYQEYWGKKKLAYEIDKNHYGYYNLIEFDLIGKKLIELNRQLNLSKEILRHQIIQTKKRTLEEIEAEKTRQAKTIKKEEESKKELKDKKEKVKEKKEETKKEDKPSFKSKEKQVDKGDLKDLDKKLEGILDSQDLI